MVDLVEERPEKLVFKDDTSFELFKLSSYLPHFHPGKGNVVGSKDTNYNVKNMDSTREQDLLLSKRLFN